MRCDVARCITGLDLDTPCVIHAYVNVTTMTCAHSIEWLGSAQSSEHRRLIKIAGREGVVNSTHTLCAAVEVSFLCIYLSFRQQVWSSGYDVSLTR